MCDCHCGGNCKKSEFNFNAEFRDVVVNSIKKRGFKIKFIPEKIYIIGAGKFTLGIKGMRDLFFVTSVTPTYIDMSKSTNPILPFIELNGKCNLRVDLDSDKYYIPPIEGDDIIKFNQKGELPSIDIASEDIARQLFDILLSEERCDMFYADVPLYKNIFVIAMKDRQDSLNEQLVYFNDIRK